VLLFRIVIMYDVKYRVLKVKQYFFYLFILLVRAVDVEFFQAADHS
jgi:hypothetical protein